MDPVNVDWNQEAAQKANQYLAMQSFSHAGLVNQLTSSYGDGFTRAGGARGARGRALTGVNQTADGWDGRPPFGVGGEVAAHFKELSLQEATGFGERLVFGATVRGVLLEAVFVLYHRELAREGLADALSAGVRAELPQAPLRRSSSSGTETASRPQTEVIQLPPLFR